MIEDGAVWIGLGLAAKATLVLGAALLVTGRMGQRSAAERHAVWTLAVAGVLALPLLSAVSPAWRVGLSGPTWLTPPRGDAGAATNRIEVGAAATQRESIGSAERSLSSSTAVSGGGSWSGVGVVSGTAAALGGAASVSGGTVSASGGTGSAPGGSAAAVETAPLASGGSATSGRGVLQVVLLLWLAGFLVNAGKLGRGLVRVRLLARRAQPLQDAPLLTRTLGAAGALGVLRPLRILEGEPDAMPVTYGVLRPVLLLPSSARSWSAARQTAVLRHELAHVRRRDSLVQLMAEVACVLYWFNPLIWVAAGRLCVEREHACDDLVLAGGAQPADYAAELLEIARSLRLQPPAAAAVAMARPSHLQQRLVAVLDERRRRERPSTRLLVPAWVGVLAVITPLSALSFELRPGGPGAPQPAASRSAPAPAASGRGAVTQAAPARDARALAAHPSREPSAQPPSAVVSGGRPVSSPAAVASAAAGLQVPEDCLTGSRNTSVHTNDNNGRYTLKWSGSRCSGEIQTRGRVGFNADFTAIESISAGGVLRIETEENRTSRRLEIRPAAGGLSYDYSVNGRGHAFDDEGRRWLSETMLFAFRRLGYMADERASAILARGGPDALLTEIGLLTGDAPRSRYFAAAVRDPRLDPTSLQRLLALANRTLQSDYYRHQVLTAAVGARAMDDAVRTAYIEAAAGISSDYYRQSAYARLLKDGGLSPEQVATVLRESRAISSAYYRAELLKGIAQQYASSAVVRPAYVAVAAEIPSDYYRLEALNELVKQQQLRAGELEQALVQVLQAASSISSDYYRSTLMVDLASRHRVEGEARTRYMQLLDDMRSETYRGRAASALLRQER